MRLGVTIPQREIGPDVGALTEFVQAAESLGYDHVMTGDHVLGANVASRPDWRGPYGHTDLWHEPMVLFGYLAGITRKVELATSILILPQRQTALVAKQAAEVDVLSGGRLRLGIGVGWNDVEYEALGQGFRDRGRRSEEQMEVMRALWTQELVTYRGRWHTITDAGINPLPVQRPIPIWIGGGPGSVGNTADVESDKVLRRIARVADGWFPSLANMDDCRTAAARLHEYARQEGRDPRDIGIQGRVSAVDGKADSWVRQIREWRDLGATHVSAGLAGGGLTSVQDYVEALERFREAVSDELG